MIFKLTISCILTFILLVADVEQGFSASKGDPISSFPTGSYITLRKDIVIPRGLSYVSLVNPDQVKAALTFSDIEELLTQEKSDGIVTISALQVTPNSKETRRIKTNKTLVVSEIRIYRRSLYTQLVIVLHHPVIKAITILTTDDIENIIIAHLEYTDLSTPQFKKGAKEGLFGKYNIAQDYFNISLPKEAVIE